MTQEELFAMAIGVEAPWFIDKINFDIDKRELHIHLNFAKGSLFSYTDPETGKSGKYKAYDTSEKTWRHLNFFQFQCFLTARIPRVDQGDGKIRQVKTPWEGLSNGFTLLFEAFIMNLAKSMPVRQIGLLTGTNCGKIWTMLDRYVEAGRNRADYSDVHSVGMDETAIRRGHDYVSIFVDLLAKLTLFVGIGKGSAAVDQFKSDLELHNGRAENIEKVSCDMSPAFIKGIRDNFPNASVTFDKFHIMKVINVALDCVRREEQKTNAILKNSRYALLKNPENHTAKQKGIYDAIKLSKLNLKTFRALRIKEAFQLIYKKEGVEEFENALKNWYFWATHSRIPKIVEAAKTIKRHWNGVVNWAQTKINNGILEGFNSIFQAAKSKAKGYKKIETIRTIIYILTAKINYKNINPYIATHSI